jgi:hypothetical protein
MLLPSTPDFMGYVNQPIPGACRYGPVVFDRLLLLPIIRNNMMERA